MGLLKEQVAPCGIDCFNCSFYETNIGDELRQKVSAMTGKDPANCSCGGCRIRQGKNLPFIAECPTYRCIEEHQVEYCYQCDDFPCRKLMPCKSRADISPQNLKVYNLCRIQKIGVDKWSEEALQIRKIYHGGEYVPGLGPRIRAEAGEE